MATTGVMNIDGRGQIVNLQLPLESSAAVTGLVQDIKAINLLCFVLINETFLERLTDDELSTVFEALLACPTMDILRISDMKDRSFKALCRAMEQVERSPPRLSNMWVVGLTLVEEESSALMIPLVEALSKIRTLEKLNLLLIAPDEGRNVESSITAEFRCTGFANERTLWSFGLYDGHISLIRDVFRLNKDRFSNLKFSGTDASGVATQTLGVLLLNESTDSALDKVQLSFDLTHLEGSHHIANALSGNRSSLKELSILVSENHSRDFQVEPLAEMLRTNSSLEWFELSRSLLDNPVALAFADALRHNQTLKVFDVNFANAGKMRITDEGFKALLEMLYVNQVLEIIPTHGLNNNEILRARIEWYLNLNESGLRRVQLSSGNTSPNEFLEILRTQEDLDYVFYLLSQNTSIFQQ